MDDLTDLNSDDIKLLQSIEDLITNGNLEGEDPNSLSGFCANLASMVPEAKMEFQHQLQNRLVVLRQQRNTVQAEANKSSEPGRARSRSLIQKLLPEAFNSTRPLRTHGGRSMKRSIVLITIMAFVVATLTVAFVPEIRTAVVDVIKRIVLGPYTTAVQVEPQGENEPRPLPQDMWIIRTDLGNFGGNAPPGVDPIVTSVYTFEEAQQSTSFHLREPTDLPEGYAFSEAKVAPIGATEWVVLFFSGPGSEIIIAQMPGGPQPSENPNESVAVASGILTDGTLEELDFDGHPAVWIDGVSLLWESDSISYQVGSLNLTQEEVIQIARSLN